MRITVYKSYVNEFNYNYLVKERSTNYSLLSSLDTSQKVYQTMKDVFHMDRLAEEEIYLICVNNKCVPSGVFLLSKGTVNLSLVGTRQTTS